MYLSVYLSIYLILLMKCRDVIILGFQEVGKRFVKCAKVRYLSTYLSIYKVSIYLTYLSIYQEDGFEDEPSPTGWKRDKILKKLGNMAHNIPYIFVTTTK